MKKGLLLLAALTVSFCAQAQDFITDDFSSFTLGDVGTDVTGVTAGQGGYYTFVAATGVNSDFQIVDNGAGHGNVLHIVGSATGANSRSMWKDGLDTSWFARTPGNDILEVEFDLYTGGVSTSKNSQRIVVWNDDLTIILVGMMMAADTKVLSGLGHLDNSGAPGNYSFSLDATPVTLPNDTWVRLGMSYNYTTGDLLFKSSVGLDPAGAGLTGDVPNTDPFQARFQNSFGAAGNTASYTAIYDGLIVRASATDTLLGTKQNTLPESKFSVSPNPATDMIRITNTENISVTGIAVTDLNGRVVKQLSYNDASNIQVNVSDLASGMYLMKITSDKGVATKKIIKN